MRVETLFDVLDSDFYTGVPDSQLQALCNFLIDKYGISEHHVIAANEGNCTALAAGHYLATGNVPVVYMQNSGIGNIVNPVASLLNDKVYEIGEALGYSTTDYFTRLFKSCIGCTPAYFRKYSASEEKF